jgi:hypothetical protein
LLEVPPSFLLLLYMFIMFLERKIVYDSPNMSQIGRPNGDESALYKCCNAKKRETGKLKFADAATHGI